MEVIKRKIPGVKKKVTSKTGFYQVLLLLVRVCNWLKLDFYVLKYVYIENSTHTYRCDSRLLLYNFSEHIQYIKLFSNYQLQNKRPFFCKLHRQFYVSRNLFIATKLCNSQVPVFISSFNMVIRNVSNSVLSTKLFYNQFFT